MKDCDQKLTLFNCYIKNRQYNGSFLCFFLTCYVEKGCDIIIGS